MKRLFLLLFAVLAIGCSSQEMPPAHKGRMFEKTGALALYSGGKGFTGPILGPGTHFTGLYDELRMVDCAQRTVKEPMTALTKDGVQFGLDMYIRFSANCDETKATEMLLEKLSPIADKDHRADTLEADQIYQVYIRPALGESVREAVSPHIANELNARREEIFASVRERFKAIIDRQKPAPVTIGELNLSNLDFPDEMDHANTERAVQSVMKDKAIAERERVTAEIETTNMRRSLAESEAGNDVARIVAIGRALKQFPDYLQYDAQSRWNDIYFHAGEKGNLILAAPSPIVLSPKR